MGKKHGLVGALLHPYQDFFQKDPHPLGTIFSLAALTGQASRNGHNFIWFSHCLDVVMTHLLKYRGWNQDTPFYFAILNKEDPFLKAWQWNDGGGSALTRRMPFFGLVGGGVSYIVPLAWCMYHKGKITKLNPDDFKNRPSQERKLLNTRKEKKMKYYIVVTNSCSYVHFISFRRSHITRRYGTSVRVT